MCSEEKEKKGCNVDVTAQFDADLIRKFRNFWLIRYEIKMTIKWEEHCLITLMLREMLYIANENMTG